MSIITETTAYNSRMRRELNDTEMSLQIQATRDLVDAAHHQLREYGKILPGDEKWRLPSDQRFDAYFTIPQIDGMMELLSIGSPELFGLNGLFINIYISPNGIDVEQVVALQTAKQPENVGKDEARWLSRYTPQELHQLADWVRLGQPVSSENYGEFFRLANECTATAIELANSGPTGAQIVLRRFDLDGRSMEIDRFMAAKFGSRRTEEYKSLLSLLAKRYHQPVQDIEDMLLGGHRTFWLRGLPTV